jgi:hypothetical protein
MYLFSEIMRYVICLIGGKAKKVQSQQCARFAASSVVDGYATRALKLESLLTQPDRGTQTIVEKIAEER